MSETEVSTDDSSSWALHPADVLDSRTRDRLFSRAGYRESLTPGAPLLVVRVETMEGSVEGDGSARVEFVADFWTSDGTQHRERFVEVEALDERSHDGLARGMATVIDRASAKLVAWVVERG